MDRRFFLKAATGASASLLYSGRALSQATPSIQLISASPTPIYDWCSNSSYKAYVDGRPHGTWADGPFNPYRRSTSDVMRAIVPHSENRSMYLNHGSMTAPSFSPLEPMIYKSPRLPDIAGLDMRHWIFTVFNVDSSLAYGIAHSENYTMYSNGTSIPWPKEEDANFKWFNSLSLFKTKPRTGNHDEFVSAFTPVPFGGTTTHSDRHLLIHPALTSYGSPGKAFAFGFLHPSNAIEDSGYVYFFAQHLPATQRPPISSPHAAPYSINGKAGPVLFRCKKELMGQVGNQNSRNGNYWEVFNQNLAWQYITRWDWADASISEAPIKPYVFFKNVDRSEWMTGMGLAQAVRKVGSKFVVMGVKYSSKLHFSYCSTLSSPLSLESTLIEFGAPPNNIWDQHFDLQQQEYLSFFDPSAPDTNYSSVAQETERIKLIVSTNFCEYRAFPLRFSNF